MKRASGVVTPRKGERTRARIVREAAGIFNVRGFAGTSVADVSAATGLEKGSVYNHFGSKDELALAAFDYASGMVIDRVRGAMSAAAPGIAQVHALLALYRVTGDQPFVRGGCPILNTAVEADDTHPALRERACAAMDGWLTLVTEALDSGVAAGQLRPGLDVHALAAMLVGALEGGIMLARLYADGSRLRAVADELARFLDTQRVAANAPNLADTLPAAGEPPGTARH